MIRFNRPVRIAITLFIIILIGIIPATGSYAQQDIRLSKGQTVYVPVYSHIYTGDREIPYYLAATISIRNIDQASSITVGEVNYYDTNGRFLRKYLEKPIQLAPNASTRFVIKESDDKGGSGANCIVIWKSDKQVNAPVIESVMIGTRYNQGISFTSRGQTIAESGR